MRTPHDMTVYHKTIVSGAEVYTREQVEGVMWEQRKAANVLQSGLLVADSAVIYVPLDRGVSAKVGDVVVKGLVSDTVSPSFTITALKAKYPNTISIKSVDTLDFGSPAMQHLKISGS